MKMTPYSVDLTWIDRSHSPQKKSTIHIICVLWNIYYLAAISKKIPKIVFSSIMKQYKNNKED